MTTVTERKAQVLNELDRQDQLSGVPAKSSWLGRTFREIQNQLTGLKNSVTGSNTRLQWLEERFTTKTQHLENQLQQQSKTIAELSKKLNHESTIKSPIVSTFHERLGYLDRVVVPRPVKTKVTTFIRETWRKKPGCHSHLSKEKGTWMLNEGGWADFIRDLTATYRFEENSGVLFCHKR